MNDETQQREIRMIPVDRIEVLNPRDRDRKKWETEVLESMRVLGLKKPISVIPGVGEDGVESYKLICGEGRLLAAQELGWAKIAALMVNTSEYNGIIMSLVENIMKNKWSAIDNLASLQHLVDSGYTVAVIAHKVNHTPSYIHGILALLKKGEKRLLEAVERGSVPISVALTIVGAGDDDKELQVVLQEAYQEGTLRGRRLNEVRRIIEKRKRDGQPPVESPASQGNPGQEKKVTSAALVRTYEKEVARKKWVVAKADHTQQRLLLTISALRRLYADEHFVTLLRAEQMETLPKPLAERVWSKGGAA